MSNKNFPGSIELISGITPKNEGNFPLVDAQDVIIYDGDDDTEGMRLPEKLTKVGMSPEDIDTKIFGDKRFTDVHNAIFLEQEGQETINRIEALEEAVDDVDLSNIKMTYRDANATLYLHPNDTVPEFNDDGSLANEQEIYTSAKVSDNAKIRMHYSKSDSRLYLYDYGDTYDETKPPIASVEIIGGGGGGLGYNLSLKQISSDSFATRLGDPTSIKFLASAIDADNAPVSNLPVTYEVLVNDVAVDTFSGTTSSKEEDAVIWDATPYLTAETIYSITVVAKHTGVVDSEDGPKNVTLTARKIWSVRVVNLDLIVDNNFQSKTETVQFQDLIIPYTLVGNVEKTTYVKVRKNDGISEAQTYLATTSTNPGEKEAALKLADFDHGSYNIEIYASAVLNGRTVDTTHYTYNIMFGKLDREEPILRLVSLAAQGEQYSELPLSFTIYKKNITNHDYTLYEQYIDDKGASVKNILEQGTVKNNIVNNNYKYYTEDPGTKTIILEAAGTSISIDIEIVKTSIEIDPVLTGLALDFSPKGRSNSALDYDKFYNNVFDSQGNEIPITWELSDNFDWVNGGWQTDEQGNSYFCIKAGTSVTINYNLFEDTFDEQGQPIYSATKDGKEFKLIFKTSNVTDTSEPFFSCTAPAATGTKNIGILLKPHTGTMSSNFDELELPYSEEDIIELDFNITPFSSITHESVNIPMMMTYEDGTPFRPLPYTSSSTSFHQATPVPITIGSTTCDTHIYRMKAYTRFLSDKLVLNNFILDGKNGAEMKERYNRNKNVVFDGTLSKELIASGQIDQPLREFAKNHPNLRVIGIEAPHFTKSKSNKVPKSKFYYFHAGGRKIEDNWIAENCIHNGQGTSSNNYRFSGKNLDLNMKQKAGTIYTLIVKYPGGLYDKKGNLFEEGTILNEEMDFYTTKDESTREEITFDYLIENPDNQYVTVIAEKTEGTIITLGDGSTTDKITLTEASVPTNYLNIKVNIASSENANNALLAKRYDRYMPYISGAEKRDPLAKNTMEFFPCVIFIRETNEDKNNAGLYLSHQEFNDNHWHFYAIGNIGDSKKTDSTRVTDKSDDKEFCQEILDVTRPLARFPMTTFFDASVIKDEDGNAAFLNNKYISSLYEYIDYTYVRTSDPSIVEGKTYYINMLESDDYSGQYTYEPRYSTDNEEKANWVNMKTVWNNFYKFVTRDLSYDDKRVSAETEDTNLTSILKASDVRDSNGKHIFLSDAKTYLPQLLEYQDGKYVKTQDTEYIANKNYYVALLDDPDKVAQWKADFETWFIKESAFYYYLFTLRYTMVDNWAKNSFWHYGKNATGQYKFEFWDYDNDTALGIDNTGTLKMPYGVEGHDKDENGAERFRASDSTFFTRLSKYFDKEITAFYNTIQNNSSDLAFNSDHFIEEFDTWQEQYPEELWRWDYNRKYKRTYIGGYGANWDNAKDPTKTEAKKASDGIYLNEMMYGRKKYQRRQFERNQGFYMSSKFNDDQNRGDKIELRFGNPGEGALVPPDYTLTLTPYLDMYLNVYNGDNRYYYNRCKAGQAYSVPFSGTSADFIYIQGASNLQSTGDLSLTYTDQAAFSGAGRLKDIILGTDLEGYQNGFLATLGVDKSNRALETLNIQNYINPAITSPKTENLINLKRLYAQGSKIETVEFANRGLMEEAYLPATISSIKALNLYNFHTLECEGLDNLTALVVDNCPKISSNILNIVANAPKLNRVRITHIDWVLNDSAVLKKLSQCKGFAEDGISMIDKPYLSGKIHLAQGTITRPDYNNYKAMWPDLDITVESDSMIIEQYLVTFYTGSSVHEPGEMLDQFYVSEGTYLHKITLYPGGQRLDTYDPLIEGNLTGKLYDPPVKPNSKDGKYTYEFSEWKDAAGTPFTQEGLKITNEPMNFYAQYSQYDRYYRVEWLNGNDSVIAYYPNAIIGQSLSYETDAFDSFTNKPGPSGYPKKANTGSVYYLFTKWEESTTYIQPNLTADGSDFEDVVTIHPVFTSANGTTVAGDTLSLSATDLYAVAKAQPARLIGTAATANPIFSLTDSPGADKIQIQLGYLPSYKEIDYDIIVGEAESDPNNPDVLKQPITGKTELVCDGKNAYATAIMPFAEDQSFTLAIDFTATYNSLRDAGVLVCLRDEQQGYGPRIVASNANSPRVNWGQTSDNYWIPSGISARKPLQAAENLWTPETSYREICVIRKVKGDSKLYLYTHDRYAFNDGPVVEILDKESRDLSKTDLDGTGGFKDALKNIYLAFGAQINYSSGGYSDQGSGIIHNARIWWDDLGDAECKKICNWVYEKMNFVYSNSSNTANGNVSYTPRYKDAQGVDCKVSFLAETLLPGRLSFGGIDSRANYHDSELKQWLNTKFVKALPIDWQLAITPVKIRANSVYDSVNKEYNYNEVTEAIDQIYIPAATDVFTIDSSGELTNNELSYVNESSQGLIKNVYPQLAVRLNRVYNFPGTSTPIYWALRSVHVGQGSRAGVGISSGNYPDGFEDTAGQLAYRQKYKRGTSASAYDAIDFSSSALYGILIGFSI